MRNCLALAACLFISGMVKADVVLANNTGGAGGTTSGTGTLNNTSTGGSVNTNITYTTVAQSNSGATTAVDYSTATAGWNLSSSVGAFTPTTYNAFNIGIKTGSATQSIQSSQTISDFYLVFNYTQGGTYDFSSLLTSIGGSMTVVGKSGGTTFTATSVNASTLNQVTDGFMAKFSGTMNGGNTYSFTTSGASADGSATLNIGVAVPEPGTLLLGGIAAACGGTGVWWKRRKRQPQPETTEQPAAI